MERLIKRLSSIVSDYEDMKDSDSTTGLMYEEAAERLYWGLIAAITELSYIRRKNADMSDADIITEINYKIEGEV